MSTEAVEEKQTTPTSGHDPEAPFGVRANGATFTEKKERRETIEKIRKEKEQPRKDFLLSGKGKASDFFDVENFQPKIGEQKIKEFEDYTESERAKFLADGELIPAKPKEKPAAKKEEQQAAKPADDSQGAEEKPAASETTDSEVSHFEGDGAKRWTQEAHNERMRSATAVMQELSKQGATDTNALLHKIKIPTGAAKFFLHMLADTRNPQGVLEYLAEHKTADGWKWRNQQDLKDTIRNFHYIDQRVGARAKNSSNGNNGNGAGRVRSELPRAGRPPMESPGGTSTPTDDGSADAAWKRKDLSPAEKGELYRERKNKEEADARRKRFPRRK